MTPVKVFLLVIALSLLAGGVTYLVVPDSMTTRQIAVGDNVLSLLIADDLDEQVNGLSNFAANGLGADGMMFIFEDQVERTFWMKDMRFDLDVLWVADGRVVKIDLAVPAPAEGQEPARMYSNPYLADTVIELPAGRVAEWGISLGDAINPQN